MRSSEQASVGRTLTLLGLFAILNFVFRALHEMLKASAINGILSGDTHGNPVTDGALLVGALGVEILLLAMLLPSLPLPRLAPLARILNLVAPLLAITGMFLVPHRDPEDHFFTVVVMMPLVAIFLLAWTWRPALPAERT